MLSRELGGIELSSEDIEPYHAWCGTLLIYEP